MEKEYSRCDFFEVEYQYNEKLKGRERIYIIHIPNTNDYYIEDYQIYVRNAMSVDDVIDWFLKWHYAAPIYNGYKIIKRKIFEIEIEDMEWED